MGRDFPDHFSVTADAYARFRPRYPQPLLARLAALAPSSACCWDVATGSGQAALALAEHFDLVVATDASARQLACAPPHPRVEYRIEEAEHSSLAAASVDLVTVAAALHWFALPAFYAEVRRVARPGAVFAAWSYGVHFDVAPELDPILAHHTEVVLGPYWTDALRHVRTGYRELEFPFAEIDVPPATITVEWTLDQVVGTIGTWSASNIFRTRTGQDPAASLRQQLAAAWGPAEARTVNMPLFFRVGRIS
ncbi:MAG: class I SAM-dependent methyltransferase [Nannocystis sp.]|nr:class I SAM-dependent methyltransferase [Nannocystis sp.]MBA3549192.1 class I SAM-dependent methyltransferase [Nannocystis sp.]